MSLKQINDAEFQAEVLNADKPVLVDFSATWCGPCKQIAPALEEIAGEYADKISVTKMDIDESPNTPGQYGVRGVPTLMIFRDGEIVATSVGAKAKGQLVDWINEAIA